MAKAGKRTYRRRTDEERIDELEQKLQEMRQRLAVKQRQDSAVLRDIPRVQRRLRKFAQLAMDHDREDLANSTLAFVAGLDRMVHAPADAPRRRGRGPRREAE